MSIKSFYRSALEEAGVGGDFFDVFPVEKGCNALVVADLSGKGLAAAQQVATVRNMLRFALYRSESVVEAVTSLHDALVEHDLLAGFATLFVGVFDPAERTLTYVNGGQEPGLIWRASTGDVEELGPTGPVLGGFGDGNYTQVTVSLSPGDVLALFTDGMTEVGPTRREFLEVEGVSRLLEECAADPAQGHDPQFIVDCLIAGVDAFGKGGFGDDIALLVGVVEGV
jgi:sigma-B regulation protein RsbU (phosphoserine phosphatase)